MSEYQVTWRIDVDAKNPKEAAIEALRIQRDPTSIATIFEMIPHKGVSHLWTIDLAEESTGEYDYEDAVNLLALLRLGRGLSSKELDAFKVQSAKTSTTISEIIDSYALYLDKFITTGEQS